LKDAFEMAQKGETMKFELEMTDEEVAAAEKARLIAAAKDDPKAAAGQVPGLAPGPVKRRDDPLLKMPEMRDED
jgi:hypothetical protein